MKKLILICAVALGLAGCVTDQEPIAPEIQVVKVPVIKQIPAPPVIVKPNLAVNSLTDKSTQDEKIRALELTNVQLIAYSNKLKSALDVYRDPTTNTLKIRRK